jgi:hypothetical protein
MTMPDHLNRLGDALADGARAELRVARRPRRLAIALVVLAVAIPAVAYGAVRLIDTGTVAASMPAGAAIFEGRNPTCSVVSEGVEYHCTLDRPPFHEVDDFTNVKEATVDATKHVNGGCVGLDATGLEWECYLGQRAVEEHIVSQGFLGEYAPEPGHG